KQFCNRHDTTSFLFMRQFTLPKHESCKVINYTSILPQSFSKVNRKTEILHIGALKHAAQMCMI
ncbi:MAG TPA: hypothetical protein DCZ71_02310, partial [Ruminococcus sp.]|nr:hypothetical protein [Ruminococcus sp.]